jgi:hypothetical protein
VNTVWLGTADVGDDVIGLCDQTGAVVIEINTQGHPNYTFDYDMFVTTVYPVLTAVWPKEESSPLWSDAKLVCLGPDWFSNGSQVPPTPVLQATPTARRGILAGQSFWNSDKVWIISLVWSISFL